MRTILDYIFDWLPLGLGVSVLIGAGFAMLAEEFKAFTAARICFYLAAIWVCGKVLMWGYFTSDSFYIRGILSFLIFGILGVALLESLRLASRRESIVRESPSMESDKPKNWSIKQESRGMNSPNIIGDNNQVVVNPDVRQELNEIQRLLQAQAGNLTPEKLLAKYPLGYVIFDLDYENRVIPYDSKTILANYELDWSVVRFTKNTATQVEIRLPDAKLKNGAMALTNAVTGGIKRVGNLGGFGIGGLMVWGEILAIRENGIVFLVGFDRAPTLPRMK
jgi:hypothetical protein